MNFLRTEESLKKWNAVPFGKKSKCRAIDGVPLTQEGICQIYQLIDFLKKDENIKSEGIFRRTGSLERQQELRNLLNQGLTLQLEEGTYSVHDCASVLKGFLAEMPDPLLTEAHFPAYCQIAESCGIIRQSIQEGKLLEALQLLLLLLPMDNKILLKDILNLLHLTASFESHNRMSPDNLAKLFTPHLLCPRKLSPEHLLRDSQILFKIISFMIRKPKELFKIPAKLIVEFRAKYEKKNILSPTKRLNESINDAANTVFTFVDHERTAKENESNPTETALAQLYAHIQSLPESSKKRKLVKQFNKENGYVSPQCTIGECNSEMKRNSRRSLSEPDLSKDEDTGEFKVYLTSTPACMPMRACPEIVFTPEEQDRKSMSPITRSTQRMTRAMQETMMTPRSRKPVLVVSGSNINTLQKVEPPNCIMDNLTEEILEDCSETEDDDIDSKRIFKKLKSDEDAFTEPECQRRIFNRTDDFNSTDFSNVSNSKLSESLLYCLNGNDPDDVEVMEENKEGKEPVLKPKQFDEHGKPIVFETSF
ncbi:hypothetical protein NQ318_017182 [Aromia moschata]|uniref:Rho-GAP domain-containing protein n=1 Tax=Aromia moschata TaxID=1265417 RepID=A0AAV8YP20_9CUCU|nr:hypothetical protein NQ318_017182 [Aromia moschata]